MNLDKTSVAYTVEATMPALKPTATYLSVLLLLGNLLIAYEQGTYFIYELVDNIDQPTVGQRLPVERSRFIDPTESHKEATLPSAERSEFEIDYQTLGTSENASFEHSVVVVDEAPQTKSPSSSFQFGTDNSTSLFGN